MQNHHLTFDWHYIGQKLGGDFEKICGLLRKYELQHEKKKSQEDARVRHQIDCEMLLFHSGSKMYINLYLKLT